MAKSKKPAPKVVRKSTAKAASAKKPKGNVRPGKKSAAKGTPKVASKKTKTIPEDVPPAHGTTLFALIIGCDAYLPNSTPEGSYPSLQGCVRDATNVLEFLRKQAGLEDRNVVRLTSSAGPGGTPSEPPASRPTYENIVAGFQSLIARANRGDHVYIHYSGHGGQCPTIVPKVKGKAATDETLVPIDVGSKTARYVRDVEIAKLLKEMAQKGLVVTAVFDCCHSGGVTRAVRRDDDPTGIRGVSFVDKTPRPADSLVGTIAELEAVARPSETRGTETTRGFFPAESAASQSVVLAACRPFELAREFLFDGGPRQGALTYWFLKLVGVDPGGLTFRTVFDQMVKRIHDQFSDQTPMLIGDPDRAILGGPTAAAAPAIPVISAAGTTVTLGAGRAALVEEGSEYAVFPPAADPSDAKARVAAIRVIEVRPNEATAEISKSFQNRGVKPGDRAAPTGVPVRLVRKVDVLRRDGRPPGRDDEALRRVIAALAGQSWVEPVHKPGAPADFVVTTNAKGTAYEICDGSDLPLKIRPLLATSDPAAARGVVDRLNHLARFQAVRMLENPDPFSPLRGRLAVELLKAPSDFRLNQSTDGLPPHPASAVPKLKDKEWVVLSIVNSFNRPVNLTILDLGSDWSVSIIDLAGQRVFPVEPGGAPFHLPLRAGLPAGQSRGSDVLKVIATVDPAPAFDLLTLPALDQPIPRAGERGMGVSTGSPLQALLSAAGGDRLTARCLSAGAQPTSGWSVDEVKIDVG